VGWGRGSLWVSPRRGCFLFGAAVRQSSTASPNKEVSCDGCLMPEKFRPKSYIYLGLALWWGDLDYPRE